MWHNYACNSDVGWCQSYCVFFSYYKVQFSNLFASSLIVVAASISKSSLRAPRAAGRKLNGIRIHRIAKCHHTKPSVINSQLGSEWSHLLNWHHQLIINFNKFKANIRLQLHWTWPVLINVSLRITESDILNWISYSKDTTSTCHWKWIHLALFDIDSELRIIGEGLE